MNNLIDNIFQKHYDYYGSIGAETIKQQAGQVEQVTSDYQGRVIYELLQNAFDKAERKIKIMVRDGHLYIANDGERFTYRKDYNYHEGSEVRGDFQALCSISTSSKDANKSIGNKGVGFKSVFSVSAEGFADIHTLGEITGKNVKVTNELISFRIYDTFTDPKNLPKLLNKHQRDILKAHIVNSNLFNKNKGVPGYYYPIWHDHRNMLIQDLLAEGFVTIIQVRLLDSGVIKIKKFFQDIEPINFHFVQLRVSKPVSITFDFEGNPKLSFTRTLQVKVAGTYFSASCNENVKALAQKANINLKEPKVAIYFKTTTAERLGQGRLYNYLPTNVASPFSLVDFHADFHTTVDRTGINMAEEIGDYNRALLQACTELYFQVINSYLEPSLQMQLRSCNLDLTTQPVNKKFNFLWSYLSPGPGQITYDIVRRILHMDGNNYQTASLLLARLALRYFTIKISTDEGHRAFFEHTASFIEDITRTYGGLHQHPKDFKKELAGHLKALDVPVIPGGSRRLSIKEEIIFREGWRDAEDSIIPDFIGLNITGFKIKDPDMERFLGVKNVIISNEVLKYYRQVSPLGKVHNKKSYTEKQQRHLLSSIAILLGKANNHLVSTHRYNGYLANHTENTVANLANFALSTIFLRIKTNGKFKCYKPAQLCHLEEIDQKFLPPMPSGISKEYLLKYLGVSFARGYHFVDKPVYDKLKKGLNYIPAIYKQPDEKADPMPYAQVVNGLRVVGKKKEVHPALINDNQYSFLTDWKRHEFYEESVQMLVKNYSAFPRGYIDQLLVAMKRTPQARKIELLRFYPLIFEQMCKVAKTVMVAYMNELSFTSTELPVFTVANEQEFRLSQLRPIRVLAYYNRKVERGLHGLKCTTLIFNEQKLRVKGGVDCTAMYKSLLQKRMFYLLLEISYNNFSANYFENPTRIADLAKKLAYLRFESAELIEREITSPHFNDPILDGRSYDMEDNCLYLLHDLDLHSKAEAIAHVLLRSPQLAQTVELVLFHRDEKSLEQSAERHRGQEFTVFQKYWITDYHKRFNKFVKRITDAFGVPFPKNDPDWFRYNRLHRSLLIQSASDRGTLPQLRELVASERAHFEKGVFAYFKLEIDETMYDAEIARLQLILDNLTGDSVMVLRRRLQSLIGRLGIEAKLVTLEAEIRAAFPKAFAAPINGMAWQAQITQVAFEAKVELIFQNIRQLSGKQTHEVVYSDSQTVIPLPIKIKKVIYQGGTLPGSSGSSEATGAGGEVDVLHFMINHFLKLRRSERKPALQAVHELILKKSKNDKVTITKHQGYYQKCQKAVNDDEALTKALIPFFYITMHYKYAFVDLFAWYNGRAVMIEVKSTTDIDKHDFSISGSEVNEALQTEDYILVRVTPDEIIFLGNPVYEIKTQLKIIRRNSFEMVPTAFNIKYKRD